MLLSDRTIISQETIALFNKSIFRLLNPTNSKDVITTDQTMMLIV